MVLAGSRPTHQCPCSARPSLYINQALRQTSPQSSPAVRHSRRHVRGVVNAVLDHAAPALLKQGVDGLVKGRGVRPHVVVRDPSLRIYKIGGIGKTAVHLMGCALQVIHQHWPGYAVILLGSLCIVQLLLEAFVGWDAWTWVCLPNDHVHEPHLVFPSLVQLLEGLDRAHGDRSAVGAEV